MNRRIWAASVGLMIAVFAASFGGSFAIAKTAVSVHDHYEEVPETGTEFDRFLGDIMQPGMDACNPPGLGCCCVDCNGGTCSICCILGNPSCECNNGECDTECTPWT